MKKNLYLFQPQYTQIFLGQKQVWFPYSIGVIWAYALQFPKITDHWNLKKFVFRRDPINEVIEHLESPKLCAFSIYMWNNQYCLSLAKIVKEKWPDCQIVVGGPQVSSRYSQFDFIDSIILNEGERCFLKVLETLNSGRCLDSFYKLPRIDDLTEVPSPYSTGLFDDMVKNNPDLCWSASIETNRGCPYACTFCDWGGLTFSKVKKFSLERVIADITWLTNQNTKTIFITDANFGIFKERDLEIAKIISKLVKERPGIEYISSNYAKMSNENVLAIAKEFGTINKGITFSMQSLNQEVLAEIKRKNMAVNDIKDLLKLSQQYGIHNYTELILGLPKETLDSWKTGISDLLDLGQHNRIEILPAMVLENTEMYDTQGKKFNMRLVNAIEIVTSADPYEGSVTERAPLVKSTDTMNTEEMIDAYMFGWIITHFHIANNSQLLAMFCRHRLSIIYREFYEKLQDILKHDVGVLGQKYQQQRLALSNIYEFGESRDNEVRLHNFQFQAIEFFYKNLESAVNMSIDVAKFFGDIDPGVIEIQKRVLDNQIWTVPMTVETNVDISTWQLIPCIYQIVSKNSKVPNKSEDFFTQQRRNKSLNNLIEKLIN